MGHLMRNKLIAKEQHGFVKNKACTTNLLESLDLITKFLSEGKNVDAIYLDFAKAFDTVPHKRLIKILQVYGIKGKNAKWIKAFLSNRRQRVVLDEFKSKWSDVTRLSTQSTFICDLHKRFTRSTLKRMQNVSG